MRIELICVGSELLYGKVNTHGSYIGRILMESGFSLARETCAPDSLREISSAIKTSYKQSRVVIVSGGLGPTFDDITREAAATALHRKLMFNKKLYDQLHARITSYHRTPTPFERKQAYLLEGAQPLLNTVGMAFGQKLCIGDKTLFLLPGPFEELQPMFERDVITYLKKHFKNRTVRMLRINFFGRAEADIDSSVRTIMKKLVPGKNCSLSYSIIAHAHCVSIIIIGHGQTMLLDKKLNAVRKYVYELYRDFIYSEGTALIEEVIARLLTDRKRTLAVAESCTGGLLSETITSIPGSSSFFKQGLIVYSNESKIKQLNISKALIDHVGAVSELVAFFMAEHIRRFAQTDYGISITGIAGPGGERNNKKTGLVYIGLSTSSATKVQECHFTGGRDAVRERSVMTALDLLRLEVLNNR